MNDEQSAILGIIVPSVYYTYVISPHIVVTYDYNEKSLLETLRSPIEILSSQ